MSSMQRFRNSSPCPVCGGYDEAPRGHGQRCYGFLAEDGRYAHCTREEYAGGLPLEPESQTYAHGLVGDCRCGVRHDPRAPQPLDQAERHIVARYPYRDEQGRLLYEVVRYEPKTFRQRRPDGYGQRGWLWNLNGTRRVLYRLPELIDAVKAGRTIFLPEGEKDVDALVKRGLDATTNSGGAKKFPADQARYLTGADVVILEDHDADGRQHTEDLYGKLSPVVKSFKRLAFPDLPKGGDISDWLMLGHTADELLALVAAAPAYEPHNSSARDRQPSGLALTRLSDLMAEPEEAVEWLVDGLLPSGGFSLLAAKPKVGKSTLARCLALAVARGESFLGRATSQGPVIYLALEEKRSEVRKHFQAMDASGEEEIYIYAATAPVDALEKIHAVVEEKRPVLLIIDPLFRMTRVKDSNDYAQVTAALEPLMSLARETGCHVLVIHHLGKGERTGADAILGSTAIRAAVDTSVILKRSERYRTICSEQRYGEDLDETTLRFDSQTRTISLGDTKEHEEESVIAQAIIDFLGAKPEGVTEAQIDEDVEGRTRHKRMALRNLLKAGIIDRRGRGGKSEPYRYFIDENRTISAGNQNQADETPENPGHDPRESIHVPLFPNIYREQEKQESSPSGTAQKHELYSCSSVCPDCGSHDLELVNGRPICLDCLKRGA
jgi:AAA domain